MSETGQNSPEVTKTQSRTVTRGHSCLVCTQRKVRCDGQRPCSTCAKSSVPCISKPSQPRATKIAKQKDDTSERLKRAEGLLSRHGLSLDSDLSVNIAPTYRAAHARKQNASSTTGPGKLIIDGGHSRYVENNIWDGLSHELPETPCSVAERSHVSSASTSAPFSLDTDGLVLGGTVSGSLSSSHPNPVRIFWLWQKYLDNVNSLVKIVHVQTSQQMILEASTDLTTIAPDVEALMFAIYSSALASISDQECQKTMGEPLDVLIDRFTGLTQKALANAGFLRSFSFTTLQAFVSFLISMRARFDPSTLWMTTGLAIRSAQRLGTHREKALRDSSVFEAEMRRRLWWQIVMLESTSAKLAGVASHAGPGFPWNKKRPLNINDGDLHPSMSEVPKEAVGITEMVFCSTRYEIGEFVIAQGARDYSSTSIEEIDAEIESLRQGLEERLLRFCDPEIPLHFLAIHLAKSATCRMKLTARRSRVAADRSIKMSCDERRMLFQLSMELIDQYSMALENKSIQNYLWQVNVFFPVEALIFVLSDLAYQSEGLGFTESQLKSTWDSLDKAYELQPRWLSDDSNAMHIALGVLAIKAWEKTWVTTSVPTSAQPAPPSFIKKLYTKRSRRLGPNPVGDESHTSVLEQDFEYCIDAANPEMMTADMMTFPEDPAVWLYWQQLFGFPDASSASRGS